MALRARGAHRLGSILLFALLAASAASLSWDLPEPRSRASKIRVHPRGNLWATGHFMGKKSLKPPNQPLLGTAPHISLRDQRLQLSHDLLRILLRKALGTSPGGPPPHSQMKGLATSLSRLSLKGGNVTSGAISLEGLKHADQLESLRRRLRLALEDELQNTGGCWCECCRSDAINEEDATTWLRLCPPREGAEWDPGSGPTWL